MYSYTLNRVIFALCNFCPSTIMQTVSLRLEFTQKQLCLKRDNQNHLNSPPVLNSPADNEGERAKIKWGQIFPCIL